jgi:hypothetical protein
MIPYQQSTKNVTIQHIALTLMGLLILWQSTGCKPLPGSQHTREKTVEVVVFEDKNRDGVRNIDELGLEDVLIFARHNIHGCYMRTSAFTNSAGQAALSGSYTHFFNIQAVPPCGYRATTDLDINALEAHDIEFGFTPEESHSGIATMRFHFWYDQNRDGVWDKDEEQWPTNPSLVFHTDPVPGDRRDTTDSMPDDLAVIPDEKGEAVLQLGNSCGLLWILEPDYWVTTGTTPDTIYQPNDLHHLEKQWVAFRYDLGETVIWWGGVHWRERIEE